MSENFSYFLPISMENGYYNMSYLNMVEREHQNEAHANQRIDKSHWICDYSDDIFQTLRETELKRRLICFRSQQTGYYRHMLLQLLKLATEKQKLARTTLHLAMYLLDCFMDNYTIRADKLNLTAITCLIVAAKIEEADMNMPKFADFNKLVGDAYKLHEFKNVEFKVLGTFNFDLIRPTVATFAEYFVNGFLTLEDYHVYVRAWHDSFGYVSQRPAVLLPLYANYEEMLAALSISFFELVDISLSYLKFANARPSLLASACIAAVRQLQHVTPVWTQYLCKLTHSTELIIAPFVDALIALHDICTNKTTQLNNSCVASQNCTTSSVLCDSPDSGIVASGAISESSSDEDEYKNKAELEEESYHCLEYPSVHKRRRIF